MNVRLADKTFEPFIGAEKIQQAVSSIADTISRDFKDKTPVFLPILDGAFVFAADLAKKLTITPKFSFIKVKSYHNTASSGLVNQVMGLDIDISGQDVIIIEDIIDTGLTVSYLLKELRKHKPASIRIATLLNKPGALVEKISIDYKGLEIPNRFIVGYGMDYNGLGRNLDSIYVLKG
ncbi:MAG TPA: hypoxanthine phosphoribosyltransferase [Bacteroidia bacterium]|nr:hypoxanthine phosphoribosyltransferase [Bacteroidia bacterium]